MYFGYILCQWVNFNFMILIISKDIKNYIRICFKSILVNDLSVKFLIVVIFFIVNLC